MNALLKPITTRALELPSYQRYDLVRTNERGDWIKANVLALLERFGACGDLARANGKWTILEFAESAQVQWDLERMKFEEMKADAKFDDGHLSEEV